MNCLKSLSQRGIKLAVATATDRQGRICTLKKRVLSDYFDAIITGDMIKTASLSPIFT